jgi:hypothetical protein
MVVVVVVVVVLSDVFIQMKKLLYSASTAGVRSESRSLGRRRIALYSLVGYIYGAIWSYVINSNRPACSTNNARPECQSA